MNKTSGTINQQEVYAAGITPTPTGQEQAAKKMLHQFREPDHKLDKLSGKTPLRNVRFHLQL